MRFISREESMVKQLRIDHTLVTHGQLLRLKAASIYTSCKNATVFFTSSPIIHPVPINTQYHFYSTLRDILGYLHRNSSKVLTVVNIIKLSIWFYFIILISHSSKFYFKIFLNVFLTGFYRTWNFYLFQQGVVFASLFIVPSPFLILMRCDSFTVRRKHINCTPCILTCIFVIIYVSSYDVTNIFTLWHVTQPLTCFLPPPPPPIHVHIN
jgi:hypothetical protein